MYPVVFLAANYIRQLLYIFLITSNNKAVIQGDPLEPDIFKINSTQSFFK